MIEEAELADIKVRGTAKIKCSCYNAFQDERYGPGRRLANRMKEPGKSRCTVCGKEHAK